MSKRVRYPGFRHAYGSTTSWARPPAGPFVCVTYSRPDEQGMCLHRESFHMSLEDAKRTAESSAVSLEDDSAERSAPEGQLAPGTTSRSDG